MNLEEHLKTLSSFALAKVLNTAMMTEDEVKVDACLREWKRRKAEERQRHEQEHNARGI